MTAAEGALLRDCLRAASRYISVTEGTTHMTKLQAVGSTFGCRESLHGSNLPKARRIRTITGILALAAGGRRSR